MTFLTRHVQSYTDRNYPIIIHIDYRQTILLIIGHVLHHYVAAISSRTGLEQSNDLPCTMLYLYAALYKEEGEEMLRLTG